MSNGFSGEWLRGQRARFGVTQEEFAHDIGVTVSTVNRWENAHAGPSKLALKAIHGWVERKEKESQL